jgi:hypothetical protein
MKFKIWFTWSRFLDGLLALCSILALLWMGYGLERQQFGAQFTAYTACFALGGYAYWRAWSPGAVLVLGWVWRLLWLLALPSLSDDFWRFLWDGWLWVGEGISPFAAKPADVLPQLPAQPWAQLYPQLNSPQYYSVYPTVCQAAFGLAAWLAPGQVLAGVVVLRLILLLAEGLNYWAFYRLLGQHGRPRLAWYWLNPLPVVEGVGNLHFEVLQLAALLWALVWLRRGQYGRMAWAWALAIGTKLTPLMLLPFVWRYLGSHLRALGPVLLSLSFAALLLWPIWSEPQAWANFRASVRLYFETFEFNASLYYLLRGLGYWIHGYNTIAFWAKVLPLLQGLGLLWLLWRQKVGDEQDFVGKMFWTYTLYYLCATTVHPWYWVWGCSGAFRLLYGFLGFVFGAIGLIVFQEQ